MGFKETSFQLPPPIHLGRQSVLASSRIGGGEDVARVGLLRLVLRSVLEGGQSGVRSALHILVDWTRAKVHKIRIEAYEFWTWAIFTLRTMTPCAGYDNMRAIGVSMRHTQDPLSRPLHRV